jgi:hypothetical protein
MNTSRFSKPHVALLVSILLLVTLAGFVSRASTKAIERAILASASDMLGFRSTDYRWEFLRDGMVLGRMLSLEENVYLFNLRLFGGDLRYALTLQEDGRPKAYANFGTGPVSPHSLRIATVMDSFFGESLEERTALDAYIAHTILDNFRNIAMHERLKKEASDGN